MINKTMAIWAAVMVGAAFSPVCRAAGGSAQTVQVKMGYFNLMQVRAAFPGSASVITLEEHARDLLRHDVDSANNQLVDMQKQNKPKEDVEKKSKELQLEITAKQQAVSQLLSSNSLEANRAIAQAVAVVAKDKGLDVVVDGSGIFAGGEKFAASGEDITEAVLKRLVPTARSGDTAH